MAFYIGASILSILFLDWVFVSAMRHYINGFESFCLLHRGIKNRKAVISTGTGFSILLFIPMNMCFLYSLFSINEERLPALNLLDGIYSNLTTLVFCLFFYVIMFDSTIRHNGLSAIKPKLANINVTIKKDQTLYLILLILLTVTDWFLK